MTTPLDGPLKREVRIGSDLYTLTISPEGVRVVPKGKRRGREILWRDVVSGDAELGLQLERSLAERGKKQGR